MTIEYSDLIRFQSELRKRGIKLSFEKVKGEQYNVRVQGSTLDECHAVMAELSLLDLRIISPMKAKEEKYGSLDLQDGGTASGNKDGFIKRRWNRLYDYFTNNL